MTPATPDLADLTACPQCDLLHRYRELQPREVARCRRCDTILFAPRPDAIATVLALAVSALVLMGLALAYPFLRMTASGLSSQASVLDTVAAFAGDDMPLLSLTIFILILVLPVTRLVLLIYVTAPLVLRRPPWPGAFAAFRLNAALRPWAMAEIFMVGVAVALVKLADMATIQLGLAFWAFAAVAVLVAAKDALTCERTIWRAMAAA